jgi:hypothetical protein
MKHFGGNLKGQRVSSLFLQDCFDWRGEDSVGTLPALRYCYMLRAGAEPGAFSGSSPVVEQGTTDWPPLF